MAAGRCIVNYKWLPKEVKPITSLNFAGEWVEGERGLFSPLISSEGFLFERKCSHLVR